MYTFAHGHKFKAFKIIMNYLIGTPARSGWHVPLFA